MSYTLKTVHYSPTPETERYVQEKIIDIERVAGSDARIEVELRAEGDKQHGETYIAEMNVRLPDGQFIRGDHRASHMHEALDIVKDEVLQQLRKGKGRRDSLMRRGGAWVKEWLRFGSTE
jgi:ribosomal subunit interface protein